MSSLNIELQRRLSQTLRSGDLSRCEQTVAEQLRALPRSPFHIGLDLSITNTPEEVAAYFDGFFEKEAARFEIGAA